MAKIRFPQIKKTVSSFLHGEAGKISKNSLLKMGMFAAVAAAASFDVAAHGSGHCSGECAVAGGAHRASGHVTCHARSYGNVIAVPSKAGNEYIKHCNNRHANYGEIYGGHDNSPGCMHASGGNHANCNSDNAFHLNNINLKRVGATIVAEHNHALSHASSWSAHKSCYLSNC